MKAAQSLPQTLGTFFLFLEAHCDYGLLADDSGSHKGGQTFGLPPKIGCKILEKTSDAVEEFDSTAEGLCALFTARQADVLAGSLDESLKVNACNIFQNFCNAMLTF